MCGQSGVKLECHHVIKWSSSVRVRQNRRNLISLCKECHRSIRNKEEKYASVFRSKISRNTEKFKREKLTHEELIKRKKEQESLTGDEISYKYLSESEILAKKKNEDYLRVTWRGIKRRVFDKKNNKYHRYGGRGIKMHEDWIDNFQTFKKYILENIGERPEGHSIDRINNDGNYEPGNLRWANAQVQKQNNSQTKMDEVMVEVTFILFHKYKRKQRDIMNFFKLNNPTSIRNIVKALAWNNITVKYKSLIKDEKISANMSAWETKNGI